MEQRVFLTGFEPSAIVMLKWSTSQRGRTKSDRDLRRNVSGKNEKKIENFWIPEKVEISKYFNYSLLREKAELSFV